MPGGTWHGTQHGAPSHGGWYGHGNWHGHSHNSHGSVGVYVGPGYWGWPYYYDYWWSGYPYGYPYPYPYAYRNEYAVPYPSEPYAETPAGAATVTYSYYCTDPAGWYPYVRACNNAWIAQAAPVTTP